MQYLRKVSAAALIALAACGTKSAPDESTDPNDEGDSKVVGTTATTGGAVDWQCVDACVKAGSGSSSPYCYNSCSAN